MKKILNPQTSLLAAGVLQPASAEDVRGFLSIVFPQAGKLPNLDVFQEFLEEQAETGRVVKVTASPTPLYSLTLAGTHYLERSNRLLRDKFRMYLLRDAHAIRFIRPRGDKELGLAGASPAVDTSSGVKGSAANKLGRTAFGRRFAHGQAYWPRISWQFLKKTGPKRSPRGTYPGLLSFHSEEQLAAAAGVPTEKLTINYVTLGLCIGISPRLISQIAHKPERHYRHFQLPKKGGGSRPIDTPRVFLRVIQWFLLDFVLNTLDEHPSVHSFRFGRSIVTNAAPHVGQNFVGSIDIEDYFGSISREALQRHLFEGGFDRSSARLISTLCTKDERLPQGAPTSPLLSNSYLRVVDNAASGYCASNSIQYTRYADDITLSGSDRNALLKGFRYIEALLRQYGLRINADKSRVASRAGQQRVTGVVVNSAAAPPRAFRKRVRAAFHVAASQPLENLDRIQSLAGQLGFLKIFPSIASRPEIKKYEETLQTLKKLRREATSIEGSQA